MNSYFQFWNVNEPVFVGKTDTYFDIAPFEPIKKRLLMQLQIGMKLQMLRGKTGSGKTTIIEAVANNLDVSEWDSLYCSVASETIEANSLTKRIMRFLDTNSELRSQTSSKELIYRLEKIAKSKRKILILIDIVDTSEKISPLHVELNMLVDICLRHHLPMHFIVTQPTASSTSTSNSSDLSYTKLVAKASSVCSIPTISASEFSNYISHYLVASHLSETIFSQEINQRILESTEGNLQKASLIMESLLIDCHIENERKIGIESLNRVLSQSIDNREKQGKSDNRPEEKKLEASSNPNLIVSPSTPTTASKKEDWEKMDLSISEFEETKKTKNEKDGQEKLLLNTIGTLEESHQNSMLNLDGDEKNFVKKQSDELINKTTAENQSSIEQNKSQKKDRLTESPGDSTSMTHTQEISNSLKKEFLRSNNTETDSQPPGDGSVVKDFNPADSDSEESSNVDLMKSLFIQDQLVDQEDKNPTENNLPRHPIGPEKKQLSERTKGLSSLANLMKKVPGASRSNSIRGSDDKYAQDNEPLPIKNDDASKNLEEIKPEARRSSATKKSKISERKQKQKPQWNLPKISLAQLTKKA